MKGVYSIMKTFHKKLLGLAVLSVLCLTLFAGCGDTEDGKVSDNRNTTNPTGYGTDVDDGLTDMGSDIGDMVTDAGDAVKDGVTAVEDAGRDIVTGVSDAVRDAMR